MHGLIMVFRRDHAGVSSASRNWMIPLQVGAPDMGVSRA